MRYSCIDTYAHSLAASCSNSFLGTRQMLMHEHTIPIFTNNAKKSQIHFTQKSVNLAVTRTEIRARATNPVLIPVV